MVTARKKTVRSKIKDHGRCVGYQSVGAPGVTMYDAGIDKTLAKLSVLRELGMRYLTFP